MLSKWPQSMSMELVHLLTPSYSEASGSRFLDIVTTIECCSFFIHFFVIGHPHPPRLMAVHPVNSTTVTVSWSEVQCFNGSGAVTHYLVQYQSMCGGAVQNVTTNGLVQTVNISSLTPNSGYTFKVAAVNVSLNGTWLFSEPITLEGTGKR